MQKLNEEKQSEFSVSIPMSKSSSISPRKQSRPLEIIVTNEDLKQLEKMDVASPDSETKVGREQSAFSVKMMGKNTKTYSLQSAKQ